MNREEEASLPDGPEITVHALLDLRSRERVVLIDVREKRERAISIIPGAISLEDLSGDPDAYRSAVIVTYCTIGVRSARRADELRDRGFKVFSLAGGILSWVHAGQRIVSDGAETRRVHVYDPRRNLLPDGYEGVW